jgi:hypothetical protein
MFALPESTAQSVRHLLGIAQRIGKAPAPALRRSIDKRRSRSPRTRGMRSGVKKCKASLHGSWYRRSFYLIPTAMELGPSSGITRACENPASFIQARQSAPVKSKPPELSISMFRLISRPNAFSRRSSSISAS